MSYASIVFAAGIIVFSLAVLVPMRWIRDDRARFERKRTRAAIATSLLFLAFALLHFAAAKMEEPPPDATMQVFDV